MSDPTTNEPKRNVPSFALKHKAANILDEQIIPYGDNTCDYKDGWSDKAVGDAVGIQAGSVGYIREEMFGRLRKRPDGVVDTLARAEAAVIAEFLAMKFGEEWRTHLEAQKT